MEKNKDLNIQNDLKNQEIKNNDISAKMNEIDEKFKSFENIKKNYNTLLFLNERIGSIHLMEDNLDIIDKKMKYLQLFQDFYNNKRPELDLKFQLKKQTKNIIIEEQLSINNNENYDDFFCIKPEALNYCNNNKNIFYKSEGLPNIFK